MPAWANSRTRSCGYPHMQKKSSFPRPLRRPHRKASLLELFWQGHPPLVLCWHPARAVGLPAQMRGMRADVSLAFQRRLSCACLHLLASL
eukprot:gene13781-biopygen20065